MGALGQARFWHHPSPINDKFWYPSPPISGPTDKAIGQKRDSESKNSLKNIKFGTQNFPIS